MKIAGVKGMNDVLPADVARWQEMEAVAREVFALYGYREVRTPAVEHAQLFARGVGEATDIVNKEMYVFEDKGEELLALRPEGTAGTVRAFIEHGAYVEGPQKWFYMGPMFRRERPQKGRYRQFHQIGCEAFGIAEPFIDAEQIALLADYFARLGVTATLKLNTVGDRACRPAYLAELKAYLAGRKGELCAGLQRPHRAEPAARPRLQGGELPAGPRRRAAPPRAALRRLPRPLRPGEGRPRRARRRLPGGPAPRARPRLLRPHRLRVHVRRARLAVRRRGRRPLRRPRRDARRARPRRASASRSARSGSP